MTTMIKSLALIVFVALMAVGHTAPASAQIDQWPAPDRAPVRFDMKPEPPPERHRCAKMGAAVLGYDMQAIGDSGIEQVDGTIQWPTGQYVGNLGTDGSVYWTSTAERYIAGTGAQTQIGGQISANAGTVFTEANYVGDTASVSLLQAQNFDLYIDGQLDLWYYHSLVEAIPNLPNGVAPQLRIVDRVTNMTIASPSIASSGSGPPIESDTLFLPEGEYQLQVGVSVSDTMPASIPDTPGYVLQQVWLGINDPLYGTPGPNGPGLQWRVWCPPPG